MRSRLLFCVVLSRVVGCGDDTSPTTTASPTLCDAANPGDLALSSAAAVGAAAGVSRVRGDLLVCNTSIANLSLPALTEVDGNVVVFANDALTTIDLPLLETIGAEPCGCRTWTGLLLEDNVVLTRVDAPSLRSVSNHVWVATNNLTTFDLPALSVVEGAFALHATRITTVEGFANLRFVNNTFAFYDNELLTEVTGFDKLASVSADLLVRNNPALTTVGLPSLGAVGGDAEIVDLPELTVLDLPSFATLGSDMVLVNTGLTDLGGLAALETVAGGLAITHHDHLETAALPALELLGGDLVVADNAVLTGVTLDQLAFLGDSFLVRDNDSLTTLAFTNLEEVGGSFTITNNAVLPTCAAENLRDAIPNIGGDVSIAGNDDVTSCP